MASKQNIAAVLDIGTTKVVALAGVKTEEKKIKILGFAKAASKGVKRGMVLNIDEAVDVINDVICQVEDQIEGEIGKVDITISGQHIKTHTFNGYKFISEQGVVTSIDVQELLNEARNFPVDPGYRIFQVIPQTIKIDNESGIRNPVGMSGKRIDMSYLIVTAPEAYHNNVEKVLDRIRVDIGKTLMAPSTTAEAVVSDDEKEAGVVVLDIGGGTTKCAIYYEGNLRYSSVIPFGGEVITNDIKLGCSILQKWAEQLKVQYGQAMGDFAEEEKVVTIPGYNGWEPKEVSFKSLAFIIQARLEEIIDSVYYQIEKSGYLDHLGAGIVITGGTANLPNLVQLIRYRTGLDSRVGFSLIEFKNNIKELNGPEFLTAFGSLKLALNNNQESSVSKKKKAKTSSLGLSWNKMKEQVSDQITMIFNDDDIPMK